MLLEVGDLRPPKDDRSVSIISYLFLKIEDNLVTACNRITDKVMEKKRYFSRGSRQMIYNNVRKLLLSDYSIRVMNWYGIDIKDGYVSGRQKLRITVADFDKLDTLRDMVDLDISQDTEALAYDTVMNVDKTVKGTIGADASITFIRIEDLNMSVRAVNGLKTADINTVGDLITLGMRKLHKVRGLGLKSITEIIIKMKDLGVDLDIKS